MSKSKVVFEFDPFEMLGLDSPSRSVKRDALEEIAEFARDELLQYYGEGKSPAAGGEWKRTLSAGYKKLKGDISSSNFANMELSGDMLDALEYKVVGGKIQLGWFDATEAAKAEGHQTGYKGHPTIKDGPKRQLLPDNGGEFKRDIKQGMKAIAKEFLPDDD